MSTRFAVGLCVSVLSLSALAQETLPKDVAQFVKQHDACAHARVDAGSHALQNFCDGIDKHLSQLKQRYAGDPAAMQRLDQFEPGPHASHGTQTARAMHDAGHPASAEPGDEVMIDPDP